jgi:CheY-like chemotaxis protein
MATGATILLVEDQDGLRMLAEDLLSEAGYKVLSAPNGRVALSLAEKHPDFIDLLITDVVMPEMNGPDLAEQLSRLRPTLMVLFVSGYSGDALLHRGAIENGTAFLQKPFTPAALRAKVTELLAKRAAPISQTYGSQAPASQTSGGPAPASPAPASPAPASPAPASPAPKS